MNTKIYAGAGSRSTQQNLPGCYDVGRQGGMGAAKRSGARGGFQPSTLAQTPRTAQRNLGPRSTKIESVSFRIATFGESLIKLGSQLPQRLMGCCACDDHEPQNPSLARTLQRRDSSRWIRYE
jgi:hypothetical protein